MQFNKQNYPTIKNACQSKEEVEFFADKEITAFANSDVPVPEEWTPFPPALLPPEGYAQVFIHSGSDACGALTRLELIVHLDGGRALYKKNGQNSVAIKVTWPSNV